MGANVEKMMVAKAADAVLAEAVAGTGLMAGVESPAPGDECDNTPAGAFVLGREAGRRTREVLDDAFSAGRDDAELQAFMEAVGEPVSTDRARSVLASFAGMLEEGGTSREDVLSTLCLWSVGAWRPLVSRAEACGTGILGGGDGMRSPGYRALFFAGYVAGCGGTIDDLGKALEKDYYPLVP